MDGTTIGLPVMGIFMRDKGYDLENCGVVPNMQIQRSPQVWLDLSVEHRSGMCCRILDFSMFW